MKTRYLYVIVGGILIFFGISYVHNGLFTLTLENEDPRIIVIGTLIPIGIGSIPLTLGIILLRKAKLRIRR